MILFEMQSLANKSINKQMYWFGTAISKPNTVFNTVFNLSYCWFIDYWVLLGDKVQS